MYEKNRSLVLANNVRIVDSAPQGNDSIRMRIYALFTVNIQTAKIRSAVFLDVSGEVAFLCGINVFKRKDGTRAIPDKINPVRVDAQIVGVLTNVANGGIDVLDSAIDRTRKIDAVNAVSQATPFKRHAHAVFNGCGHETACGKGIAISNRLLVRIVLRSGDHGTAMTHNNSGTLLFGITLRRIDVHQQRLKLHILFVGVKIDVLTDFFNQSFGQRMQRTQVGDVLGIGNVLSLLDGKKTVLVTDSICIRHHRKNGNSGKNSKKHATL